MPDDEQCRRIFRNALEYGEQIYAVVRAKDKVNIPDLTVAIASLLDLAMRCNDMLEQLAGAAIGHPGLSGQSVQEAVDTVQASQEFARDMATCGNRFRRGIVSTPEMQGLLRLLDQRMYGEPEKAAG